MHVTSEGWVMKERNGYKEQRKLNVNMNSIDNTLLIVIILDKLDELNGK